MLPKPVPELDPNTSSYETTPLVKPTGFREYDARWLFGAELNLMGVQALGLGLAKLVHESGKRPEIVVGHDYRSYSTSIKLALIAGLMAGGVRVKDIGLVLSPMAYFAQFALDCPCVAMVTASHNDNGWTGVKMGFDRPLTFGPSEMNRLKDIVLTGTAPSRPGGGYEFVKDIPKAYLDDLAGGRTFRRRLKVVAACGNGTAGAFAPQLLERLGCEVVPLDCELDHRFPRYNPNPEDLRMLKALGDVVRDSGADVGLGFDGDGDRCGVVDETGTEVFADKIGVMLARDLAAHNPNALFVVDIKSTGLFKTDPELRRLNATTDYWKTGHSYIKARVRELSALAGFEKSGHFFFGSPVGRGYDDGLLAAIMVLEMLDRHPGHRMSDLHAALPKTWISPTMSPHCPDEVKYCVVEKVKARFARMLEEGALLAGVPIADITTINGVRVTLQDGTWGLVRASSNKPELVVVVESPVSEEQLRSMFIAVDGVLRENSEVGQYNQRLQ